VLTWLVIIQYYRMPKNFVCKTFDRWLARSAGRFHHPTHVVVSRREYFVLQFAGVTPAIQCVVKKKGTVGIYRFQGEESSRLVFVRQVYEVDVGIYVIYQGETWDILTDFDVYQKRTSTGQYYCDECRPPEMFPSRAALWVAHCFEPLLAWANDHLQASQWLCLFGDRERSTWAELTPAEDVPARRSRKGLVYACPVVRGTPCHPPRP
jgi:hypothetical protein